jgi:hypothetical protein
MRTEMLKRIVLCLLLLSDLAFAQVNNPAVPAGSNGQLQYNNAGQFGAFTLGGDCTFAQPNITCTKFNGTTVGTIAGQNANAVTITGGTITGLGTPSAASDVAIKSYVDNVAAALNPAIAVAAATTGNLPNSPAYNNAAAGIGAFITSGTNSVLVLDGYTPVLNDRILVKNETGGLGASRNGVYTVTQLGVAAVLPWILTRALDYDQASDINSTGAIPVVNGTVNATTTWVQTAKVTTVGTDSILFSQFSLAPSSVLQVANNLSDLASAATARSNLGLAAVASSGSASDLTAGNLANARMPSGALTGYTSALACGSATFTTNTARSQTWGKQTLVSLEFTINALGTCTNSYTFNLPNTAQSAGGLAGRDEGTGLGTYCSIHPGGTSASCIQGTGSNLTGTSHIYLSGTYENQ